MKYIKTDESNNLVFAECSTPEIAEDECLIKVHSIGVNRADILQRHGKYAPPVGESSILGIEVSGTVAKVGNAVSKTKEGDLVFAIVPGGGYAEYVKVKADHLIACPKTLTQVEAASLAETCITAFQTLVSIGKLQAGQNVLIHAGASGVGSSAIQIAKQLGANVVVTAGSKEKCDYCMSLGADEAINYKESDFVSWQKTNKPEGFDVILDCVSGDYLNKNINVSALDGKIVIIAILGGRYAEKIDVAKMLMKRLSITASTLRNQSNQYKTELINEFLNQIKLDEIKPCLFRVIDWQYANEAHELLANNENMGKVVMTINKES